MQLNADGSVRVASGTQDIGTGTYTVIAQMAAELLGVDVARVKVVIGDSSLPPGPWSGGSMATASMVPALQQAAQAAIAAAAACRQCRRQPFRRRRRRSSLPMPTAASTARTNRRPRGDRFEQVLASARISHVEGKGKSSGTFGGEDKKKFSSHSFGAHFVEVTWQPEIARLRVSRVLSVIDAGRIINPLTGRNQIEGAVVMGVGMALFEQTHYDKRNGKALNSNLADYIMATHADAPADGRAVPRLSGHPSQRDGRARHRRNRPGRRGRGDHQRGASRHRRPGARAAGEDRGPARLPPWHDLAAPRRPARPPGGARPASIAARAAHSNWRGRSAHRPGYHGPAPRRSRPSAQGTR